jgi:dTDP-4-amino-4,6-dideoxygalactose transaminase
MSSTIHAPTAVAPARRRLAIDGGDPAFAEPRHVGGPNIVDIPGVMRRIEEVLESGWLSNRGPLVRRFEERVAEIAGVEHCIAVCNATAGLEIAIRALGMAGEVIVPSWTFVATAHALQWQEIKPVFADVDPTSHTLDPAAVERMLTPLTSGIIGTHLFGRPCDVRALRSLADRHGLALLFDAAHAFGVRTAHGPVGSLGDAEVFSFHATKFLNTFEGGAVVTDNDELAHRVRLMTNFGFEGRDNVTYLGTNGKLHEVSAAMGLVQLDHFEETIARNHERYLAYQAGLADIPGIHLLPYAPDQRSNYQYIVVEVDAAAAGTTRDDLLRTLEAENVLARRYFYPGAHRMQPYRSLQPHAGLLLPETERLAEATLVLPTGLRTSIEDIAVICSVIEQRVAERASRPSEVTSR